MRCCLNGVAVDIPASSRGQQRDGLRIAQPGILRAQYTVEWASSRINKAERIPTLQNILTRNLTLPGRQQPDVPSCQPDATHHHHITRTNTGEGTLYALHHFFASLLFIGKTVGVRQLLLWGNSPEPAYNCGDAGMIEQEDKAIHNDAALQVQVLIRGRLRAPDRPNSATFVPNELLRFQRSHASLSRRASSRDITLIARNHSISGDFYV